MKYLAVLLLCGVVVGQGRILLPDDSPWDVPAVQEITTEPPNCSMSFISGSVKTGWYQWHAEEGGSGCVNERPLVTTCADKRRILEHDEQTPPKYWCRKVQN
jgi:hypothetical protein